MANAIRLLWRKYGNPKSVTAVSRKLMSILHEGFYAIDTPPIHTQRARSIFTQPRPLAYHKSYHTTSPIDHARRYTLEKRRDPFYPLFLRNFSTVTDRAAPEKKKRKVPKLILLQNPFKWLLIKIDFSVLRRVWDPTFQEKEFKFGTKQAIARVTQVISEGRYNELNGLLTKAARTSLLRDLERNWAPRKRTLLELDNTDIQISSPRRVYFIKIADKRFCDVDMVFLALKWVPVDNVDSLIFSEIFARFHRDYTPHCIPEWTIAYFKVTRLEIIRK